MRMLTLGSAKRGVLCCSRTTLPETAVDVDPAESPVIGSGPERPFAGKPGRSVRFIIGFEQHARRLAVGKAKRGTLTSIVERDRREAGTMRLRASIRPLRSRRGAGSAPRVRRRRALH